MYAKVFHGHGMEKSLVSLALAIGMTASCSSLFLVFCYYWLASFSDLNLLNQYTFVTFITMMFTLRDLVAMLSFEVCEASSGTESTLR